MKNGSRSTVQKTSKRMNNGSTRNLSMSSEVYALRRKVIAFIYEAKALAPGLPRLDVRVTEDHASILGMARMSGNIVWLTSRAIECSEFDLRTIVFHEILHAVYGVEHDEECPLMKAHHSPLTKAVCHSRFKAWAGKKAA